MRRPAAIFVPTKRDRLLPALVEGRGDVAVANLTVTEDRQALVDFTDPVISNVSEIAVTGPASPAIKTQHLDRESKKQLRSPTPR